MRIRGREKSLRVVARGEPGDQGLSIATASDLSSACRVQVATELL
jgi:hypothetical protein